MFSYSVFYFVGWFLFPCFQIISFGTGFFLKSRMSISNVPETTYGRVKKLDGTKKSVIQRKINWGKCNVSFSSKLIGEKEMCNSVPKQLGK